MRPYREKSRFGTGLIIYVLVFLILTAVGLIFFYDWLEAYELTRPYNAAISRLHGPINLTPGALAI